MRTLGRLILRRLLAGLLSVSLAFAPAAFSQDDMRAPARHVFTQQELDQMLAPIALYPDSLLSQILMAATYPLEVVEAARWSRANPDLNGDQAVTAIEQRDWDPSVKSLVAFPQILTMMDDKLEWTKRLGDAFLSQQPHVMDTVQAMRQRAYAAGNLRSTEQLWVEQQGQTIVVQPANPHVVYVPYYNPVVVYGPWWWPAHPPVYWHPWPGYYARPGLVTGFVWGSGITISAGFFFGGFDWHHRHAKVVNVNNYYYHRPVIVNREPSGVAQVTGNVNVAPDRWRHDPAHRRGVAYRDASLREQFGRNSASLEARRDFRGRDASPQAADDQDNRRRIRGADNRRETTADQRAGRRDQDNNNPVDRSSSAPNRADVRVQNRPDARETAAGSLQLPSRDGNRPELRGAPRDRADARIESRAEGPDARRVRDDRRDLRRDNRLDASERSADGARDREVRPNAVVSSPVRLNDAATAPRSVAPDTASRSTMQGTPNLSHPERRPHTLDGRGQGAGTHERSARPSRESEIRPNPVVISPARVNETGAAHRSAAPGVAANRPVMQGAPGQPIPERRPHGVEAGDARTNGVRGQTGHQGMAPAPIRTPAPQAPANAAAPRPAGDTGNEPRPQPSRNAPRGGEKQPQKS